MISGYSCRPDGSTEGANAFHLAYELGRLEHDVTILTRLEDRDSVLAGLREEEPVSGAINVEAMDDSLPTGLPFARMGPYYVYLRYSLWQARAARWMKARNALFDVVHHVSWASISLPIGAA